MATKPPKKKPPSAAAADFWHAKTLEQLTAEQGVQPVEDFDAFMRDRRDVGPEDEDTDEFLIWLREVRREGP